MTLATLLWHGAAIKKAQCGVFVAPIIPDPANSIGVTLAAVGLLIKSNLASYPVSRGRRN